MGVRDGFLQHVRRERTAERHVDDTCLVVGGVANRIRDTGHRARARAREHLERHDLEVEADASNADAVVGRLRDRAGDVRAVTVVIVRVRGVADEVVRIDERQPLEVGQLVKLLVVLVRDAGIEHGDDDTVAVGELPGLGHADLAEVPLVLVVGIVREAGLGRR